MKIRIRIQGTPLLEEVFTKKRPLRDVVKAKMEPRPTLLRLIGSELIHGFKGGARLLTTGLKFGPNGRIVSQPRGSVYPAGIWRQTEPSGKGYKALSKITIREKRKAESPTPNMALMNTHELVNGLIMKTHQTGSVDIRFRTPELNRRSHKMEKGGFWVSPVLSTNPRDPDASMRRVFTPPRKHRAIQPAVKATIQRILLKWMRRFG